MCSNFKGEWKSGPTYEESQLSGVPGIEGILYRDIKLNS